MAFVVPDLRDAGILYLIMDGYALFIFSQKKYEEEIFGVKSEFAAPLFVGVGTGIGFLILSALSPAFSLLTPTLSFSVSADVRWFIIVIMAPIIEELWRSSTLGLLEETYRMSFLKRNTVQAIAFALLHLFVYGVAFGAYDSWIEVYGATMAIAGSLFAAFAFGWISGFMMTKFKNIVPSMLSHGVINFYLVSRGLIVIL